MARLTIVLLVLAGFTLVGCASEGSQKRQQKTDYEQASPFTTGQDPYQP